MKLSEIAGLLGAEIPAQGGDPDISGVAGLPDASDGDISFLGSRKNLKDALATNASAVITSEYIEQLKKPQIIAQNPQYAFAKLIEHFYVRKPAPLGISPTAFVAEDAAVGEGVSIYPFAYVGPKAEIGRGTILHPGAYIGEGSILGEDCIIYPNAVVREGVRLGNRVILHPGAIIGADGFGFVFHEGRHYKIPQVGGVILGDDVEIGAGSCVDRATLGNTAIGKGTKLDNLVQIGHNSKIGQHCILVAYSGTGGSARIGNYVTIAGKGAIADHIEVGDRTIVAGGAGVIENISGGVHAGFPSQPHREWLKASAAFRQLPELIKKVRELEEKLKGRDRDD